MANTIPTDPIYVDPLDFRAGQVLTASKVNDLMLAQNWAWANFQRYTHFNQSYSGGVYVNGTDWTEVSDFAVFIRERQAGKLVEVMAFMGSLNDPADTIEIRFTVDDFAGGLDDSVVLSHTGSGVSTVTGTLVFGYTQGNIHVEARLVRDGSSTQGGYLYGVNCRSESLTGTVPVYPEPSDDDLYEATYVPFADGVPGEIDAPTSEWWGRVLTSNLANGFLEDTGRVVFCMAGLQDITDLDPSFGTANNFRLGLNRGLLESSFYPHKRITKQRSDGRIIKTTPKLRVFVKFCRYSTDDEVTGFDVEDGKLRLNFYSRDRAGFQRDVYTIVATPIVPVDPANPVPTWYVGWADFPESVASKFDSEGLYYCGVHILGPGFPTYVDVSETRYTTCFVESLLVVVT